MPGMGRFLNGPAGAVFKVFVVVLCGAALALFYSFQIAGCTTARMYGIYIVELQGVRMNYIGMCTVPGATCAYSLSPPVIVVGSHGEDSITEHDSLPSDLAAYLGIDITLTTDLLSLQKATSYGPIITGATFFALGELVLLGWYIMKSRRLSKMLGGAALGMLGIAFVLSLVSAYGTYTAVKSMQASALAIGSNVTISAGKTLSALQWSTFAVSLLYTGGVGLITTSSSSGMGGGYGYDDKGFDDYGGGMGGMPEGDYGEPGF